MILLHSDLLKVSKNSTFAIFGLSHQEICILEDLIWNLEFKYKSNYLTLDLLGAPECLPNSATALTDMRDLLFSWVRLSYEQSDRETGGAPVFFFMPENRGGGAAPLGYRAPMGVEMAADRVRVGYPRVSSPAVSGLEMVSHPQFSVSVSGLVSGSVLGLVFHPWISNGYPK
jgi:hypothetical protein